MSSHHHMNFLSPYARGYVHGIILGFILAISTGGLTWMFLKFH